MFTDADIETMKTIFDKDLDAENNHMIEKINENAIQTDQNQGNI